MKHDISCVIDQQPLAGAIYISNLRAANSHSCRKKYNIQSIISVAIGADLSQSLDSQISYLRLPARDNPHYELRQHFEETFQFIEKGRLKGNVLVHCIAGISRSATIVAAYLIRKQFMQAEQAIKALQRRRNAVNPNLGFRQQLKVLQKQIQMHQKYSTAKQNLTPNEALQFKDMMSKIGSQNLKISSIPSCNLQGKKDEDKNRIRECSLQLTRQNQIKSKKSSKIEKIKANTLNKMEKKTTKEDNFQNLLVSNIYRNKLRLR